MGVASLARSKMLELSFAGVVGVGGRASINVGVILLQKVWYQDGSTRVETFSGKSRSHALRRANEALDYEIADQWEQGRVTVTRAICGEREVVEGLS